jgi:hypothetical protein
LMLVVMAKRGARSSCSRVIKLVEEFRSQRKLFFWMEFGAVILLD